MNKHLGFLCALLVITGTSSYVSAVPASKADQKAAVPKTCQDHRQSVEAWRIARHQELSKTDGWLTIVGLEWLQEGENRIGQAADIEIRMTGGPEYWGSVFLQDGRLRFQSSDDSSVKVNGVRLSEAELVPENEGEPTTVSSGTLSFYAIFRGSYALRIKDSKAQTLLNFSGVENYLIDGSWCVEGRIIPAKEDETIEIVNAIGQVSELPLFGTFEFERDGETFRLLALKSGDSETLWFIFSDKTNGHGTYGAGRFLYSEGMPEEGRLTVDFNKSENPPCAFNPWSTCPLPPEQNRMNLRVTAGEKDFHVESE